MELLDLLQGFGTFFCVEIILGLMLYLLVIFVLLRHRSECFKGSYYSITLSLGFADVLSGLNVFFEVLPFAYLPLLNWLYGPDSSALQYSSDLSVILNIVVISHLLSITVNRVVTLGFPTTKAAQFVNTQLFAIICVCISWGHGGLRVLIFFVTGCNYITSDLYLPVSCGNNTVETEQAIYTAITCTDMSIVGLCILLHLLLIVGIKKSRNRVKSLQKAARERSNAAEKKLLALSMFMTLTLIIPYSVYLIAYLRTPGIDTNMMAMVSVEGIILNGVGNAVFHVLFNSLIREKLWTIVRRKKNMMMHTHPIIMSNAHRVTTHGGVELTNLASHKL